MTKVLFVTMDMLVGTERLMPWRTVCEVTSYLDKDSTYQVLVYSGENNPSYNIRRYNEIEIYSGNKDLYNIVDFCIQQKIEILIFPLAFRDYLKPLQIFDRLNIKKIGYIPGGIYPLSGITWMAKHEGIKKAKSYIIEKICNNGKFLNKIRAAGFSEIITFSESTRDFIVNHGWDPNKCITIAPGLDEFRNLQPDYSFYNEINPGNERFILFSGAPAAIRGSRLLLKAFDKFAGLNRDVKLIMLMRTDLSSDYKKFESELNRLKHKDRVLISYEKLSPSQLKAFFEKACVVTLPFILVPSEIPLTFFEVLSCGTPIIAFENNGTTEYFKQGVYTTKKRSVNSFGNLLQDLLTKEFPNKSLRADISKSSLNYPTWKQVAEQWNNVLNQ